MKRENREGEAKESSPSLRVGNQLINESQLVNTNKMDQREGTNYIHLSHPLIISIITRVEVFFHRASTTGQNLYKHLL